MTAYAGPRAAYRPYLPPLGQGALDGVRGSLRQWRSAFHAVGTTSRQDVDALLLLARD